MLIEVLVLFMKIESVLNFWVLVVEDNVVNWKIFGM